MQKANGFRHLFRGLVFSSTVLISNASIAAEWYWTMDGGGVWDDDSGFPNWADSLGNTPLSSKPETGDSAFLVLPYQFSFCDGTGYCYLQPVQVQYRNRDNPTLESVAIESWNILMQWYGLGVDPAYTNLTSNFEYIGGSPYAYDPPPSYHIDPLVGIYPQGEHIQNVGTNRVNKLLQIGGTVGGTGRYVLESAADGYFGTLSVGQIEIIGAEGNGEFEQNGGVHLLDVGSSLIIGQSSTGTGSYRMTSGWLDADIEILGAAGYGEFTQIGGNHHANQFTIGQDSSGEGLYTLTNGTLSVVAETIGDAGWGRFIHNAGDHYAGSMVMGAQDLGFISSYELNGGTLDVGTETIGDGGRARFNQNGGEHFVDSLVLGSQESGLNAVYNLAGGTLDVGLTTTVGAAGDATFYQSAGTSFNTGSLEVADGSASESFYQMDGGLLHVQDNLKLGELGKGDFYHYDGDVTIGADQSVTGELSIRSDDDSYLMNSGTLTVNGSENIFGTFRQIGGSHTISAITSPQFLTNTLNVGDSSNNGNYYISDGNLNSPRINVGSGGDNGGFRQNHEFSTVTTTYLDIGVLPYDEVQGEYKLTDGSLNVGDNLYSGDLNIGMVVTNDLGFETFGKGTLQLEGGELKVKGNMNVGAGGEGSVSLTDGLHSVIGTVNVGQADHTSYISQSGGTFNVDGTLKVGVDGVGFYKHLSGSNSQVGVMMIEDTGLLATEHAYTLGAVEPPTEQLPDPELTLYGTERIGFTKKGSFQHYYGYHTVNNELILGSASTGIGNYTQSGGELAVTGTETLGYNGRGVFDHIGGKHTVQGNLILGHGVDSSGTYNLQTDGELVVNGFETIGRQGSGAFNQFDGSHTVNGTLYIGGNDSAGGGDGDITLINGILAATKLSIGYGANSYGSYHQGGGTATFNTLESTESSIISEAFFNLTDGNLNVNGHESIGRHGLVEFNQSGGIHRAGSFYLGEEQGGKALYKLTGTGHLDVTGDMTINDLGGYGTPEVWGYGGFAQEGANTSVNIGGKIIINPSLSNTPEYTTGWSYLLLQGELVSGGVVLEGTAAAYGAIVGQPPPSHFVNAAIHQTGGTTHTINGNMLIRSGGVENITGHGLAYGRGGVYFMWGGTLIADEILVSKGSALVTRKNQGRFEVWAGEYDANVVKVSGSTLLNEGLTTIRGDGHNTIIGSVENRGEMALKNTTAVFDGTFVNSGEFHSEGSDVQFGQLIVEATGYMVGNSEDVFSITGDFVNGSLENTLWNTDDVSLVFNGDSLQNFYLAGDDLGVDVLGYQDNFAWDQLIVGSGIDLNLWDGNIEEGAALYVGALGLESGMDLESLLIDYIFSDFNIYYDPTRHENAYLQGLTFALNGDGFLMPSNIPVPPSVWLLGSGLIGLFTVARRRSKPD